LQKQLAKALADSERESRWRLRWEGEAHELKAALKELEKKHKDTVHQLHDAVQELAKVRRARGLRN
jgi:hypothetical protein